MGDIIIATDEIKALVQEIAEVRAIRKAIEKKEESLKGKLELYMGDAELLATDDGEELLTWKYTAPKKVFDAKKFEYEHPQIYKKFLKVQDGHRRLVLKEISGAD